MCCTWEIFNKNISEIILTIQCLSLLLYIELVVRKRTYSPLYLALITREYQGRVSRLWGAVQGHQYGITGAKNDYNNLYTQNYFSSSLDSKLWVVITSWPLENPLQLQSKLQGGSPWCLGQSRAFNMGNISKQIHQKSDKHYNIIISC